MFLFILGFFSGRYNIDIDPSNKSDEVTWRSEVYTIAKVRSWRVTLKQHRMMLKLPVQFFQCVSYATEKTKSNVSEGLMAASLFLDAQSMICD